MARARTSERAQVGKEAARMLVDILGWDAKEAERAWLDFNKSTAHPRKEIDFASEIENPWPKRWVHAGRGVTTYYASDKWKAPGDMERYYHDHKNGVNVWVAGAVAARLGLEERGRRNSRPPRPPRGKPKAVALLGESLGIDIERPDGSRGKLQPKPGSQIACSPDRKKLYVIEEDDSGSPKVVVLLAGGKLTVEPRGIVG